MKPFRFTLQAVRALRQRQEQVVLKEYAGAVLAHQRALEAVQTVRRQLESAWALTEEKTRAGLTAAQLTQLQAHALVVAERLRQGEAALAATLLAVNRWLQKLAAARRQREVVDKLFEKQKLRHQRRLLAAEQKLLDELAQTGGMTTLFDAPSRAHWN